MRLGVRLLWVLLVVGCSQVTNPGVPLYVTVVEQGHASPPPLEGVTICETDTTNCVVTDMNGEAILWLPPDQEETSLTADKEGYLPWLEVPGAYVEELRVQLWMWTDEATKPWWEALETDYPQRGTGAVEVTVGFAGATLELVDATGTPFYEEKFKTPRLHCDDAPEPCLEATTEFGLGGFVDVGPGEVQIQLGGTAQRCVPASAWPGDGPNRIKVPIRAGYITIARVTCPPP